MKLEQKWRIIWLLAAVGTALLTTTGFARLTTAESRSLDKFILEEMKAGNAPGLAAGIVKHNRLVWSRGFGWADIENEIPMTEDTIQNIGPISKTITTTAVIQLWEQGKFKLDDDVNKYLPFKVMNPHFPDDPITFRQLLTHRSSIKDGPAYDASYACGDPTVSLKDWLTGYLIPGGKDYSDVENFHRWRSGAIEVPKEPRAYSNVAFGLLGYLVEVISGTDFSHYCKEHVFMPLGMTNTGWYLSDVNIANHAVPYTFIPENFNLTNRNTVETLLPRFPNDRQPIRKGEYFALCLYSFPNYPDGLIRTSVRDLSLFLMAYIKNGAHGNERILKKETTQTMLSGEHFGRGLCWDNYKLKNGDVAWGHGGSDPGIKTRMVFRAKDGVGVIIFSTVTVRGRRL